MIGWGEGMDGDWMTLFYHKTGREQERALKMGALRRAGHLADADGQREEV